VNEVEENDDPLAVRVVTVQIKMAGGEGLFPSDLRGAKSDTELRSFLLITIGRLTYNRITRRLTVIYNIYVIHKIILTHFTNE
jgi:hypothetical protein